MFSVWDIGTFALMKAIAEVNRLYGFSLLGHANSPVNVGTVIVDFRLSQWEINTTGAS